KQSILASRATATACSALCSRSRRRWGGVLGRGQGTPRQAWLASRWSWPGGPERSFSCYLFLFCRLRQLHGSRQRLLAGPAAAAAAGDLGTFSVAQACWPVSGNRTQEYMPPPC